MQLISNARDFWKMYSVWAYIIIALLPDIFNLAIEMDVINSDQAPALLSWIIKFAAFVGAVVRLVKQASLQIEAQRQQSNLS